MNESFNQTLEDSVLGEQGLNVSPALEEIAASFNKSNILVPEPVFSIILTLYILLTTFAVLGNLSVVLVVALKKGLRTTRNIFILHLAISDILSACSIPLTITDGLTRSWVLGDSPLMCRIVKTVPNMAVFMSSFTIVAIAIDRYYVICRPTRSQINKTKACLIYPVVFLLAIAATVILFVKSRLFTLKQLLENQGVVVNKHEEFFSEILICVEDWNDGKPMSKYDRLNYTLFSFGIQFLLPLVVIIVFYTKIYKYIKLHQYSMTNQRNRMKRTSIIFFFISVIFCVSWLPFSLFSMLSEAFDLFEDSEALMLCYYITHLLGMSSSCTNPILYAFFNTNLSTELKKLPGQLFALCTPSLNNQTGEVAVRLSIRNVENTRNNKPSDEHQTLKGFNDLTTTQLRLQTSSEAQHSEPSFLQQSSAGAANASGPSQARKAGPVQDEEPRQVEFTVASPGPRPVIKESPLELTLVQVDPRFKILKLRHSLKHQSSMDKFVLVRSHSEYFFNRQILNNV